MAFCGSLALCGSEEEAAGFNNDGATDVLMLGLEVSRADW